MTIFYFYYLLLLFNTNVTSFLFLKALNSELKICEIWSLNSFIFMCICSSIKTIAAKTLFIFSFINNWRQCAPIYCSSLLVENIEIRRQEKSFLFNKSLRPIEFKIEVFIRNSSTQEAFLHSFLLNVLDNFKNRSQIFRNIFLTIR